MFPGLRHHTVVSGDNQQDRVDTADPGQHVADEAFMPRHINKGQIKAVSPAIGKAEVNGHAPALFFCQAVRINTGQRLDQGGFAVVNMSGCGDNHGAR